MMALVIFLAGFITGWTACAVAVQLKIMKRRKTQWRLKD
jgi:uncharacterized membrane protein YciS (DUF1049 family)